MASSKKKLLILLGAGSSVPLRMPSVSDLGKSMAGWAQNWSAEHRCQDYYGALAKSLTDYYTAAKASIRPDANFERILGNMAALYYWMTPSPSGNALREIACESAPPPDLSFPFPDDFGPAISVADQLAYLLIALAKHMREKCLHIETEAGALRQHGDLLHALGDRFDLGIYNLNYDTGAVRALPSAFTGFAPDGAFRPDAVHGRPEWGFIYHLHGSVHHSLVGQFGEAIRWQPDLSGEFFDGHPGLSTDRRSDGRAFPKTTLIAGGFKLDQLLVEPFQSFHAALIRHVHEADAILLGGYGFGDEHVNRAFHSRLARGDGRPPVMILTWAPPFEDPMEFRGDAWGYDLSRTLAAPGPFREPGHVSPPMIDELVDGGGFEVSAPHHVAIWHGGFVEAAAHTERISAWLAGDATDASLVSRA
jgi:hypothetical protein